MFLDEEYKKELNRRSKEMCARIKESKEGREQVIKDKYNGNYPLASFNNEAYYKDTFNMIGAMSLTGLDISEIRMILLELLPEGSSRRNLLIKSMTSTDKKEKYSYPGGYNSYLKDLDNGYFGTFDEGCGVI